MASKGSSIYDIFSTTPFDFDWTNRLSAQLPDAPEWVWWSFVLEAFLIVFGGFWSVLFMIIIIKYPLFHKNLHFLIVTILFVSWIMQMSRFIICLGAIFIDKEILKNLSGFLVKPPFMYFEVVRIWAGSSNIAGVASMIVERILATRRVDSYERNSSLSLVGILILSSWGIGIVCTYLSMHSPFSELIWISIIFSLMVFVGIGYVYVKRVNLQKLRESKLHPTQYTLSQSYQIRENLRLLSLLRSIVKTFIKCMSVVCIIIVIGIINQSLSNIYVLRSLTNILSAISGPVVLFSGIRGIFFWSQKLKELLRYIFICRKQNDVEPVNRQIRKSIANLDGRRLAFDVNEEGNIYFQQLKDDWS